MSELKTTDEQSLKTLTTVIYILQALSFFLGITAIIAVIINYVRIDAVRGSWLESHFRWQIRTFWFALLWSVIATITIVIGVGVFIYVIVYIWIIYRIVKGWLNLNDRLPMYMDQTKSNDG